MGRQSGIGEDGTAVSARSGWNCFLGQERRVLSSGRGEKRTAMWAMRGEDCNTDKEIRGQIFGQGSMEVAYRPGEEADFLNVTSITSSARVNLCSFGVTFLGVGIFSSTLLG